MPCPADQAGQFWYRDKDLLLQEIAIHDSNLEIARVHGRSETVYRKWRQKHGIERRPQSIAAAVKISEHDDSWLLAALKKNNDRADVVELANIADKAPQRVTDAMERLGLLGYRVKSEDSQIVLHRVPPPSSTIHKELFRGEKIRFGVVSDTHLGSKNERLEELHIAYDRLAAEGITTVLHPGDLVCGLKVYKGQANDIHKHTYEDQVAYAAENYPVREGITTRIIAGNHDLEGMAGDIGANPVLAVCNVREDMEYMGDYSATIELEQGTRLYMLHPRGGMGYAADYKIRKIAESFEGGSKPHAMLVGHYHRRGDFEARAIQSLLCGCFESGSSYGNRLGLGEPAVGFHIVTATIADDASIVRWQTEWFRFYAGRTVG